MFYKNISNVTKNIFTLTRPANIIMAFLGVFLGAFIANIQISNILSVLLAGLSASLIAGFGNIDNDIVDIKIDTDEEKNRPLVNKAISIKQAKFASFVFLVLGNLFVIHLPILFCVSILVSILLIIYNRVLKRLPFIGNLVVAFMVGLTFLYGNLLSLYTNGQFNYDLIPFFLALFINLAREITKDCEDIKGDSANKIKTLPIIIGLKNSQYLIQFICIILLFIIVYPSIFLSYSYKFYIINILSTIPIICWTIFALKKPLQKEGFGKLSKLYKIGMLTGVFSLVIENL